MTVAALEHCLIGTSAVFRTMLQTLEKMATFDAPVLITGETGCGKEVAARAIHYLSPRRDRPFVPLNCGALPDHLVENELFGHRRGAYTDAREHHPGVIAQAEGGTLFLDEIDALSAKAQVALLRFLQDGSYRPLGAASPTQANVRILAATHANLALALEKGSFRADLHYRLNVLELRVPALRQRPEDIPLLASHVIRETAGRYGLQEKPLHPQSLDWLMRQPWPGNIRELENCVQRAFLLSDGALVMVRETRLGDDAPQPPRASPEPSTSLHFNTARQQALLAFEHAHLSHLMQLSAGNVTQAARLAGKERRSLGKLLKAHGIEPARFRMAQ
ncbi:MAG TPA: sigma-54 dependent transcriptional regulator [Thiobacillaceae bacterium]|nr:sigma-54 dependent transcriptional regulator [Thiobacillaceae bacterium]HNU63344.1 sigma-54 dependent transcriptional regulator [Thiobacillaceae bacterium]